MTSRWEAKRYVLYSAVSSPLDRSKRLTLFPPDRPDHSDTNSTPLGSILARQQLRAKTKSLAFPPPSLARYQGSYGSLKSMKVQDILAVKIMYLKVLNFQETFEKSIKVHIKRVLLLINNYVCYFAGASFEAIVCKKIFCGGKSHSCRRRPIILPASQSFPANRSIG